MIQPAFCAMLSVVDEVIEIDRGTAERAKEILLGHARVSARDAIPLAVMEKQGVARLLGFDKGFDGFPGITGMA